MKANFEKDLKIELHPLLTALETNCLLLTLLCLFTAP